ncbi:TonB-dependent receptor plug domain-containing protein [Candidatus Methylacidiphilum infernorum]|uniref:Outer membrane receptor protein, mostly Fe transport n=1 Tax=Methylacidiphilum infernorum (isolate V4) TaxID=481448 RepID=B3DX37_METI4|nr:TonB-dependent receptor plug domain-containing protein [Candidatus Methylacidiphilum infernorum]ACD82177.1 Outer membrane receptor protein, mostly Fe transport [Methylacidiphilum infernorum V4]
MKQPIEYLERRYRMQITPVGYQLVNREVMAQDGVMGAVSATSILKERNRFKGGGIATGVCRDLTVDKKGEWFSGKTGALLGVNKLNGERALKDSSHGGGQDEPLDGQGSETGRTAWGNKGWIHVRHWLFIGCLWAMFTSGFSFFPQPYAQAVGSGTLWCGTESQSAAGTLSGGPGSWDQAPVESGGSMGGSVFGEATGPQPLEKLLRNHPLLADSSSSSRSNVGTDPAASSPSSPSLANPSTGSVTMPETIVAITSESVLPGDYDISSVYGTPLNIVDTPRSVQVITQKEIQSSAFISQNVMSLMYMAPGLYMGTTFGEFSVPNIRGMPANKYINGMLSFLPGTGYEGGPMNMNDFDQINIVQGPTMPSLLSIRAAGGYLDIQTKRPYWDGFHGMATVMEGMYDQNLWQADVGGPINDKLAFRFSYLGDYSGSYYVNDYLHNQAFYLALSYKPYDNYEVFFNNSFYTEGYNEIGGINRPTQELISDHEYLSAYLPNTFLGPPVFIDHHKVNYNIGPELYNYGVSVLPQNYNTMRYVPLSAIGGYRANLLNPGSGGYVESERAQVIQRLNVNDGFQIINNSNFEYFSYNYQNLTPYFIYTPGSWVAQNNTSFIFNFDTPIGGGTDNDGKESLLDQKNPSSQKENKFDIHHTVNVGFEFDYANMIVYEDDFEQVFNVWNMGPLYDAVYPSYFQFNLPGKPWFSKYLYQDVPIPGRPGEYFNPGNFSSTDSESWYLRPYWQHQVDLGKHFSIFMGASVLALLSTAQNPPGTPATYFDFGQALHPTGAYFSTVIPNFDFSPRWKPNEWTTVYFDFQQAYLAETGAFYGVSPLTSNYDLHLHQRLYSGGINFSLLNGKLNILTAAFDQEFQELEVFKKVVLVPVPIDVVGGTLQVAYQPDRHLWLVANAGYIIGTFNYAPPLTSGPSMDQPYPSNYVLNNPAKYPFDLFGYFPQGTYPYVGWPNFQTSFMATYTFDWGLGFFASFNATSPQYLAYDYIVRIPWQYTLNLGLSYTSKDKHWVARLWVWNVTDQHNWMTSGSGFATSFNNYDELMVSYPFWIQGQVSYQF